MEGILSNRKVCDQVVLVARDENEAEQNIVPDDEKVGDGHSMFLQSARTITPPS
jgi:hypothetical protein